MRGRRTALKLQGSYGCRGDALNSNSARVSEQPRQRGKQDSSRKAPQSLSRTFGKRRKVFRAPQRGAGRGAAGGGFACGGPLSEHFLQGKLCRRRGNGVCPPRFLSFCIRSLDARVALGRRVSWEREVARPGAGGAVHGAAPPVWHMAVARTRAPLAPPPTARP